MPASLASGLFVMLLAFKAYSSVLSVSSTLLAMGDSVAMIHVLARPPSDSCSRRVSFESRYCVRFMLGCVHGVYKGSTMGTGQRTETACSTRGKREPYWDVGVPPRQRRDDAPERKQALVDVPRLARPLVLGAAAAHALRPGLAPRDIEQSEWWVRAVRRSQSTERERRSDEMTTHQVHQVQLPGADFLLARGRVRLLHHDLVG